MRLIGIVLLLISVGLVVGPVGAAVVIYRDDLTGLVVPPEIKDALKGNTNLVLNADLNGKGGYTYTFLDSFAAPTFVSANVNYTSRTFTVTVNLTNSLKHDVTLNRLSGEIDTPSRQQLAIVNLSSPLTIPAGQSALVTINCSWTQLGGTYFKESYQQTKTISLALTNLVVDVNGLTVKFRGPISVENIPLSLSGVTSTG
jgi:hypothetical protein